MHVVFLLLLYIHATSQNGLRCITCDGATSHQECDKTGTLRECLSNEIRCAVEERRLGFGSGLAIFKSCKQPHACNNNFLQNERAAWWPSQCNPNFPNSVCRCCCDTDGCNRGNLHCIEEQETTCFPILRPPQHGSMICTNSTKQGSVCNFQCDDFFELVGFSALTCGSLGKWSSPTPRCFPILCNPLLTTIRNGIIQCSDRNALDSTCRFTCSRGYKLNGEEILSCVKSYNKAVWNFLAPTCEQIKCHPELTGLFHSRVQCTDSNNLGSLCFFQCDEKHFLTEIKELKCECSVESSGTWNRPPPICSPYECHPIPELLENRKARCNQENKLGSVCRFWCNDGYTLVGYETSTCVKEQDGVDWNSSLPVCKEIVCHPKPRAPLNGSIECNDSNKVDSLCTFRCAEDFLLEGKLLIMCGVDGEWSDPSPKCSPLFCRHHQPLIVNGLVECSDGRRLGSICRFTCHSGYLINGSKNSICQRKGSDTFWSSLSPTCEKIVCSSDLSAPDHGNMKCSDSINANSVCLFQCDDNYYLDGVTKSLCELNGLWSNLAPFCQPILCHPQHSNISFNGIVFCSNDNWPGSECRFKCDNGFFLAGNEILTCLSNDFQANWNSAVPKCRKILCQPELVAPSNGSIQCTDHNNVNSVCSTTCAERFLLQGTNFSVCESSGRWSNPAPSCVPILCDPAHQVIDDGAVSCSEGNHVESVCRFTCIHGYNLLGSETLTCINKIAEASWNSQPPTCERIACFPGHVAPANGLLACTDANYFKSLCTFRCEEDHFLDGSKESTCESTGAWSSPPPICVPLRCHPPRTRFANGKVRCNRGNHPGSICGFTCQEGYRLSGSQWSTCTKDSTDGSALWSSKTPICEPLRCPDQGILRNGRIRCSDGNAFKSRCRFECNGEPFYVSPPEVRSNVCMVDGRWSNPKPCCARPCPPYAVFDLVMALDSSSSVGADAWNITLEFARMFVEIHDLSVLNFALFRYNSEVDSDSEIRFDSGLDRQGIYDAIKKIPYDGTGTHTGKALDYAREVVFSLKHGKRPTIPDVVVVITDGKSQDDVATAAGKLRENGIKTFAVGVTPIDGVLDYAELLALAGSFKNILVAKEGYIDLNEEFAIDLSRDVCGDPCSHQYLLEDLQENSHN